MKGLCPFKLPLIYLLFLISKIPQPTDIIAPIKPTIMPA